MGVGWDGPNPRARRSEFLDPQPDGLRQAARQRAIVAGGMNAVLGTHAPALFVSSCLPMKPPLGRPGVFHWPHQPRPALALIFVRGLSGFLTRGIAERDAVF